MNRPQRRPPDVVPLLTDVVHELRSRRDSGGAGFAAARESLEDGIIHNVLQRIDVILEKQLANAVAQVVREQTANLAPRLREEVELAVRLAVMEAVSAELDHQSDKT